VQAGGRERQLVGAGWAARTSLAGSSGGSGSLEHFQEELARKWALSWARQAHRATCAVQVTIEYKNVTISTNALLGMAGLPTVGNTLPHLVGTLLGKGVTTVPMDVLKDVTGVIKPVRVLGAPTGMMHGVCRMLAVAVRGTHGHGARRMRNAGREQ